MITVHKYYCPAWQEFNSQTNLFFDDEWSIASVMQQLLNLTTDQSFRNHCQLIWCSLMEELNLVTGSCVLVFRCVWQQARRQILTQALVGGLPGGPGPGSVLVKRVTSLAVGPRCMVLADAEQPPLLPLRALTGMAIALAPEGGRDGYRKCHYTQDQGEWKGAASSSISQV